MLLRLAYFFCLFFTSEAFSLCCRIAKAHRLNMQLGDSCASLVGSDIEFPEFDPLGFTKKASAEKVEWYRAAELKHGRVAMLASLGQLTQYFYHINDKVFDQSDKPFKAFQQVCLERPAAAAQILLAIFAVEALGQFNKVKEGAAPGDLGFDPLKLRPVDPEAWEKVQLRELKNGRLAMLASAGMLYAESLTGNGVLEAYKIGAVSPFGDGLGIF